MKERIDYFDIGEGTEETADVEIFSDSSMVKTDTKKKKRKMNKKEKRMFIICVTAICLAVLLMFYSVAKIFMSRSVDGSGLKNNPVPMTTPNNNADKVQYILVAGFDEGQTLTDIIMVVMFDIEAQKVKVLQIPRDTYVGAAGSAGSANDKINALYGQGKRMDYCVSCHKAVEKKEIKNGKHTICNKEVAKDDISGIIYLMQSINNKFGIPIDNYATFTLQGFINSVDAVGGVTVDVKQNAYFEGRTVKAGTQLLKGRDAEVFVRYRGYATADIGRVEAQRQMWSGVATKILDMTQLEFTSKILPKIYKEISTSMSIDDMRDLKLKADKIVVEDIEFIMLPGTAKSAPNDVSYYSADADEILKLINEHFMPYGTPITSKSLNINPVNGKTGSGNKNTTSSKAPVSSVTSSKPVESKVTSEEEPKTSEPEDNEPDDNEPDNNTSTPTASHPATSTTTSNPASGGGH